MSQNDINTKTSQVVDRDAEQTEENLSEQRQIRRDKLKALQDADRNPFVVEKWNVTAHSMDIKENFDGGSGGFHRRKNYEQAYHG